MTVPLKVTPGEAKRLARNLQGKKPKRKAESKQTPKGRMVQIDDFIKELQETRAKLGNTCVYIRDVSWGAVALNRQREDEEQNNGTRTSRYICILSSADPYA